MTLRIYFELMLFGSFYFHREIAVSYRLRFLGGFCLCLFFFGLGTVLDMGCFGSKEDVVVLVFSFGYFCFDMNMDWCYVVF